MPFIPSAEYIAVLALLPMLSKEELHRLKLQDIHQVQMDRQGQVPYPGDRSAEVGRLALRGKVSN